MKDKTKQYASSCRTYAKAKSGSEELGPFKHLPGEWVGKGTGWNMIALPFQEAPPPPDGFKFRILMNQYDETLNFSFVDDNVANRGLQGVIDKSDEFDQFVVTLDYQQVINQIATDDFPESGDAGAPGLTIHHEPGLWLHMKNLTTEGLDIARLASIPHGNSVLTLGKSRTEEGKPNIPVINGLPLGTGGDVSTSKYLAPYKKFIYEPFFGIVPRETPDFPGFEPLDMNSILRFVTGRTDIERSTILTVDSTTEDAGVSNAPFVVKQAEPVSMKSTFWIQELAEKDEDGNPKLRLQYSQVVMLDFFPRRDQLPGRIQWPHISINTLEKVNEKGEGGYKMKIG